MEGPIAPAVTKRAPRHLHHSLGHLIIRMSHGCQPSPGYWDHLKPQPIQTEADRQRSFFKARTSKESPLTSLNVHKRETDKSVISIIMDYFQLSWSDFLPPHREHWRVSLPDAIFTNIIFFKNKTLITRGKCPAKF